MKILISNVIWGKRYCALFARYSVATLLAPGNLPRLAQHASITVQIVTTKRDRKRLLAEPTIAALRQYCTVEWELTQDYGIGRPPTGGAKYAFLSALQNIGIARAASDQDAIVFNYADFIWADGSLPRAVDLLARGGNSVDAVLGFCLPVDRDTAIPELDRFRNPNAPVSITLPPRDGAHIAIEHLHREARRRIWQDPEFTVFPTYLIWPVEQNGILIRAYHQSILALRVRPHDPQFAAGIRQGTLDGSFTAQLAEDATKTFVVAAESDDVLVFSLYDTSLDSRIPSGWTAETSLARLLKNRMPPRQRRFADQAIYVRSQGGDESNWRDVAARSAAILHKIDAATPFDHETYAQIHRTEGIIPKVAKLPFPYREIAWRLDYLYRLLIAGPVKAPVRAWRRVRRIVLPLRAPSL